MALQTEGASFLRYRIIPRCRLGNEARKEKLKEYAEMTMDEYDKTLGCPLPYICGLCNLASKQFYENNRPSIFYINKGQESFETVMQHLTSASGCLACVMRVTGWVVMMTSIFWIASPFVAVVKLIPVIGPFFSKLLLLSVILVACSGTAMISSLVMCVVYITFRPVIVITLASLSIGGMIAFKQLHYQG